MSQSVSASYTARSQQSAKALEVAFVIAGWPTVYTIARDDYSPAGDLADFTEFRAWANAPKGSAAKIKGRPEEGKTSIGELTISVLDRVASGTRAMTDLLSRQAYLDGTSSGVTTTLSGAIGRDDTTLTVASTTGFASSGTIHVGLECVHYTGTTSTTFTGCTRAHLLTSATAHTDGMKVYAFMPSIFRRKAFIYKGYQDLPVSDWARAFGGVISGMTKEGAAMNFKLSSMSWEMYGTGKYRLVRNVFPTGRLGDDLLAGDHIIQIGVDDLGALDNGHYIARFGQTYAGLTSVEAI